jgi:hypothetical protein
LNRVSHVEQRDLAVMREAETAALSLQHPYAKLMLKIAD